jgi:hypothetical protein
MNISKSFLIMGLGYGALGMSLGIHMAASQNHSQAITHAHLLLVGFLLSIIYAIIYRLWLDNPQKLLSRIQFFVHHIGVFMMVPGLYLLYGGHVGHETLEPLLASSSVLVLVSLLLMMVLLILSRPASNTQAA